MSPGIGLIWALLFSVPVALLSLLRKDMDKTLGLAAGIFGVGLVALFFIDSMVFYSVRPMMTFPGLALLIFINLLVMAIIVSAFDALSENVSLGRLTWVAVVAMMIVWIAGANSGHDAYKASHLVRVTQEGKNKLPASTTSNMVIVSPDIATNKAQQAMSSGIAGQRNFNTYLNLGPATLQFVDGHMWYVFPLEFDGSGNKARLHAINPGYIMISAEDPNAVAVEHYDNQYSMIVSLGGGQGSEPERWAYSHGYSGYLLDDATLEINDQGLPFYTVTLLRPQLGWSFPAPVGMLVINAHTGQITRYDLKDTPPWVDRVYSSQMATNIVNWYGNYAQAGFGGIGSSNANRYHVSGDPILVYTGGGHPDWRMLLTSFNTDSAVYRIVLMDAHTGAIRLYTPESPMGVENTVYDAFNSGSGVGASLIKANQYRATDLRLHVIYGHLTWMVTYETNANTASFVGVGFVDAYHVAANNVAFGDSKSAALQNYQSQLAGEANANGNAPGQGGNNKTVTGVIAPNGVNWDVAGGQKTYYISLAGDNTHVYIGTVSNLGPALVEAQPGDPVTITYLLVSTGESSLTMRSFTDTNHPLAAAGA